MRYQIEARSTSKPEDILVRDSDGQFRLFVGSVNSISRHPLRPELVSTLLARGGWESRRDEDWLRFEDLREKANDRSANARSAWRRMYRRVRESAIQ